MVHVNAPICAMCARRDYTLSANACANSVCASGQGLLRELKPAFSNVTRIVSRDSDGAFKIIKQARIGLEDTEERILTCLIECISNWRAVDCLCSIG